MLSASSFPHCVEGSGRQKNTVLAVIPQSPPSRIVLFVTENRDSSAMKCKVLPDDVSLSVPV